MRKLTVGMCVYDDFEGLYFTIQSLRAHHQEIMSEVEFVIVNNNPNSNQGRAVRDFIPKITEPTQYLEFTGYSSTSLRNKIFELAETPYVICLDCHVILIPDSLKKLIDYYDEHRDEGNLLHGPLLHDDMKGVSTHFDRQWGSGMMGRWGFDDQYEDKNSEPFEINAQGLGLFSCRKDSWLGFNRLFRGFGGEENYIHDKYRKYGKKVMCLPFLQWVHRFVRVNGIPYSANWVDRYSNYIIGRMELEQEIDDVEEAFKDYISAEDRSRIKLNIIDNMTTGTINNIEHTTESPSTSNQVEKPTSSGCGCKKG